MLSTCWNIVFFLFCLLRGHVRLHVVPWYVSSLTSLALAMQFGIGSSLHNTLWP